MADDAPPPSDLTYPAGYGGLLPSRYKSTPYEGLADLLAPYAAMDMAQMWALPTEPPKVVPTRCVTAAEKQAELSATFAGQPRILMLHALCIAASRRNAPPDIAGRLFRRFWAQSPYELMDALDMRWKLSALQTFDVFGENEAQRKCARSMTVFFQMTKLYEYERLYSGFDPAKPFFLVRKVKSKMPFGLASYSMVKGDLDKNMLGQLWMDAEADPVLRPLACRLLNDVNAADEGLFRRLKRMKIRLKRQKAQ